ncbi:unnamed protein product [Tilletia controversa]|uniref:Uncharacterized protein n=1 Tax=Tilletia controversa TaxID=13291 RepID=A0A8X7SVQ0_9BASI|nr:hypothetical protein A4X06_0g5418 [Tilletia controversa]CAD6900000.1 unnamed protein product [Tilletia controversa]CAD6978756.1 unnamed protein product [Tilletia controversa]
MAPSISSSDSLRSALLLARQSTTDDSDNYCSFYGCGLGVGARAGIIAGIILCLLVLGSLAAGVRRRRLQRMHQAIYVQQSRPNGAGNPYAAGSLGGYPPQAARPQNQWYAGPPPGTPPVEDSPYAPPYGYKAPEGGLGNGYASPNQYPPPPGPPPAAALSNTATGPQSQMPSSAAPSTGPLSNHPTGGSAAAAAPASSEPNTTSMPSMPEPAMYANHTGNTSAIPSVPPPAYQPNDSSAPNATVSNNNNTTAI